MMKGLDEQKQKLALLSRVSKFFVLKISMFRMNFIIFIKKIFNALLGISRQKSKFEDVIYKRYFVFLTL